MSTFVPTSEDCAVLPLYAHSETVDVHVFPLDVDPSLVATLGRFLNSEERDRANRFRGVRLGNHWIVARARLKQTLSRYCNVDAASICFGQVANRKPVLDTGRGSRELYFNLSHSGNLVVIAVTRIAPIGVDVERVRDMPDLEVVARRFFSPSEHARLRNLPVSERRATFFRCWTRKEAVIKATGEGMSAALDSFDVSICRSPMTRLISYGGDTQAGREWQVHNLEPKAGYVGALAIRRRRKAEIRRYLHCITGAR